MKNYNTFLNKEDDDFLTRMDKKKEIELLEIGIDSGDWINLTNEYGDVWHKVIKTYNPDHYYSTVYFYVRDRSTPEADEKKLSKESFCYYHYISKVVKELPEDARIVVDEKGYHN